MLQQMSSTPMVIGVAGGTGSGKTTAARGIEAQLIGYPVAFLDQDAYYRDLSHLSFEERSSVNFDHPDSLDTELLAEHIDALKAGKSIEKPTYSFVKHIRLADKELVAPCNVVVVEGILVLAVEAIRKRLELKIYVDTDDDVRIIRRIERDLKERGRDLSSVVEQYFKTVRPMHLSFVEPSKRWADIIIPHGGHSQAAIDMVAGSILSRLANSYPSPISTRSSSSHPR